jgi:hypothetical protein
MNKKSIFDTLISILCIIGLIFVVITFIQEVIINVKIIKKQNDCIKLNSDYYCKVEE